MADGSSTGQTLLYVFGGIGAFAAGAGGAAIAFGHKSWRDQQDDGSSKLSRDGGAVIYGGAMALLLIPAIIGSIRARDGMRDSPVIATEKVEPITCPAGAVGKHQLEIAVGGGSLRLETDAAGEASVTLGDAFATMRATAAAHPTTDGGYSSASNWVKIDGTPAGTTLSSKLNEGFVAWATNVAESHARAEETRVGKCNADHTAQFEKVATAVFGPSGAQLEPVGKVTLVLSAAGVEATVKLDHGGTYHTVVIGRGVGSAEFRDLHGDAITQPSALLGAGDFRSEARQFIAGDADALRVRAKGEGCAVLLVAREKPRVAVPTVSTPSVDEQGLKLIRGPIEANGVLNRVHIVSDTVGVVHKGYQRLTITNSVISAPICVRTPGSIGLTLTNNTLDCDLGVQFETTMLLDNQFIDNRIRGQMQNVEF
ncbi:MAG: hypothetical protein ABIQ16_03185 [Polyangiaceae bacterium]